MENQKSYYFMAGLPRSGSTLLSAILNQNPRFHSGPSSPVTSTMLLLEQSLAQDELFLAYPKPQQAAGIIANVLPMYYSDVDRPVIFDKNRSWVNRIHYISGYFGIEPKIICPVRDTAEILASFIAMHRRNPYQINGRVNFIDEMLIKSNIPLTDDNRCAFIAGQNGILGQSYQGIKDAVVQGHRKSLHFVEYNDLCNRPKETIEALYDFIGEKYYKHDFKNIENIHKEHDDVIYGFADMHDVRKSLSKQSKDPSEFLSEQILQNCEGSEFWRTVDELIDGAEQPEESGNSNFIG